MNWFEAIVLGVVQGLTEFLPVSSSGHLVLLQHLFGLEEPELLFDISVHVGTLLAVLVVFQRDLVAMVAGLVRSPRLVREAGGLGSLLRTNDDLRMLLLIVLGCIPTGILGILFAGIAETLFSKVWLVGITLCLTGILLWLTRGKAASGRNLQNMFWRDALIIGLAQGVAIMPGVSRSGTTIAVALFLGIDRQLAGRFSFLLAIPAILGALMLGLDGDLFQTSLPMALILAGSISAAVVGYMALIVLLRIVKKGQFHRFAPYCWVVGLSALVFSIF